MAHKVLLTVDGQSRTLLTYFNNYYRCRTQLHNSSSVFDNNSSFLGSLNRFNKPTNKATFNFNNGLGSSSFNSDFNAMFGSIVHLDSTDLRTMPHNDNSYGIPGPQIMGGLFYLSFESTDDDELFYYWLKSCQMMDGCIEFFRTEEEDDIPYQRIDFWDAFLVRIKEQTSQGAHPLIMECDISAAIVRINKDKDLTVRKPWYLSDIDEKPVERNNAEEEESEIVEPQIISIAWRKESKVITSAKFGELLILQVETVGLSENDQIQLSMKEQNSNSDEEINLPMGVVDNNNMIILSGIELNIQWSKNATTTGQDVFKIISATKQSDNSSIAINDSIENSISANVIYSSLYDKKGNSIGQSYGDNKAYKYIVKDKLDVKNVKAINKKNEKVNISTLGSAIRLPSDVVLRESLSVITRTENNGGFREECSLVMTDESIIAGNTGPAPRIENNIMIADARLPNIPNGRGVNDVEATIHSHPTEVYEEDGIYYPQSANLPSNADRNVFRQYNINIIVGRLGIVNRIERDNRGQINIPTRSLGIVIYGRTTIVMLELTINAVNKILGN